MRGCDIHWNRWMEKRCTRLHFIHSVFCSFIQCWFPIFFLSQYNYIWAEKWNTNWIKVHRSNEKCPRVNMCVCIGVVHFDPWTRFGKYQNNSSATLNPNWDQDSRINGIVTNRISLFRIYIISDIFLHRAIEHLHLYWLNDFN